MKNLVKNYQLSFFEKDIISGIIVAALTIPVSMGYAQIAGLPPVYGLYVSVLPVITYAIFSSSPQLIFGVDSSSAAIAGSVVMLAGYTVGSPEILYFLSFFSLFTGLFIILFSIVKLGKFIIYVSEPVMSGIIFGISLSVLWSQIPKIIGLENSESKRDFSLESLFSIFQEINYLSLLIGLITILIIIFGKKFSEKIPFSLIVLVVFTFISMFFKFEARGIVIVGEIPAGFPPISIPKQLPFEHMILAAIGGLFSSIMLTVDSLLTSKSFANKNNYVIDENKEILAFGLSNVVSSFSGILPTSASVSRTAANEQFKGKTQVVSVVSAVIIVLILIFANNLLYFMPQPVLSGIVFSALANVLFDEYQKFKNSQKISKREGIIWLVSMLVVLQFGVLLGIAVGMLLSFVLIIVTNTRKSFAFLGTFEKGNEKFYYDLNRNKKAKKIKGTILFRFTNSLYFTNIDLFIEMLQKEINSETTKIIIDAHAMTTIDITATRKLKTFLKELQDQEIKYYFVNTIGDFRDSIVKRDLTMYISENELPATFEEAIKRDGGN